MNEEIFIGGWPRTKRRERSQNERHAVWKRAKSLHSAEGNHLARAIELLGLPYAEPEPLADDDPLLVRMRALMAEPRARAAAAPHPRPQARPPRPRRRRGGPPGRPARDGGDRRAAARGDRRGLPPQRG